MSRLPTLTYREVIVRLRRAGFVFDRQAKGAMKSGTTQTRIDAPLCQIIRGLSLEERCAPSFAKLDCR